MVRTTWSSVCIDWILRKDSLSPVAFWSQLYSRINSFSYGDLVMHNLTTFYPSTQRCNSLILAQAIHGDVDGNEIVSAVGLGVPNMASGNETAITPRAWAL